MGLGRRLTLIILIGAAATLAALYGPSWVDHRHNPHIVFSMRVVNFDRVGLNVRAEKLFTIRNAGHASISEHGGGGSLQDFNSVCPRRLGRVERMQNCGFSSWPADECSTLKPGESCAVAIHFTPRTTKPYSARFCFIYAATGQDWRQTETCVTATGRGEREGKRRPAR
jgi:hypothetical protein